MVGEEGEGVEEYRGEDEDNEEDGPDLRYEGRPWAVVSWGYIRVWMERSDVTYNQIPPQCPPFSLRCGSRTTKERFIFCESLSGNWVLAYDLVRSKLRNTSRRRHDSDSCSCDSDSSFTVDGERRD